METTIFTESYFAQCSDEQLYHWCVMFLNGADLNSKEDVEIYKKFKKEVETRDQYLKDQIDYLQEVI